MTHRIHGTGISIYIGLIFLVNVGKYTTHVSYGNMTKQNQQRKQYDSSNTSRDARISLDAPVFWLNNKNKRLSFWHMLFTYKPCPRNPCFLQDRWVDFKLKIKSKLKMTWFHLYEWYILDMVPSL